MPTDNNFDYYRKNKNLKDIKEEARELEQKTEELEKSRIALMNILEDVEIERKKAEEERDKTLAIISNLTDGLIVLDPDGKISLVNPQTESFFNVEAKDMVGKNLSDLKSFPLFYPLIELIGDKPMGIFRKELPVKENLTLEVSVIPMINGEEDLGTLIILHDIAREKLIEQMKSEFVSVAAHQLRTPLSAIKWALRLLLDGDVGQTTEEQKDVLEKAYESNERMIDLINDLLNVSRIEEGRFLYKPISIDLEAVVQSVIDSYKEMIEKKKINFEFKKPGGKLPNVLLDAEKMSLAIQNLLDNAIKYTPEGGNVTVSLKQNDGEIEFSIKDTGVGIPKDQQDRIFTKFFRGANVMRLETEGSGLGLFITKNIIEAHGGKLWFESEEGKGTTFYFTIPVANIENQENIIETKEGA